jgi:hypothetical protein
MPWCQISWPPGVSHSTVPTRRADPSESGNSPRTVAGPERLDADDLRPVVVLERARDDLAELAVPASTRTTSGTSVARPPAATSCLVSWPSAAFSMKTGAALEELARDGVGFVDVAARVAAEVEDDPVRARLVDLAEGRLEVVARARRELIEADEGGLRAGHEGPRDRRDRDVARTILMSRVGPFGPGPGGHGHAGTASPRTQSTISPCRARSSACRRRRRSRHRPGARLLGGAALEHAHDERQAVLGGIDPDADADVLAGQVVGPRGPLLGRQERVWPVSPTASVMPLIAP